MLRGNETAKGNEKSKRVLTIGVENRTTEPNGSSTADHETTHKNAKGTSSPKRYQFIFESYQFILVALDGKEQKP